MDPSPSAPPASVERFLEVTADFQLGALETEQARPETAKLSFFAREDPSLAVDVLKSVDQGALARLQETSRHSKSWRGHSRRPSQRGRGFFSAAVGRLVGSRSPWKRLPVRVCSGRDWRAR